MSTYSGKIIRWAPDIHVEQPPPGTAGILYRAKMVAWHAGEYVLATDHEEMIRMWHAERQQFRNLPNCACAICAAPDGVAK